MFGPKSEKKPRVERGKVRSLDASKIPSIFTKSNFDFRG